MSTPMTGRLQYAADDGVVHRLLVDCLDVEAIWSLDHEPAQSCLGACRGTYLVFADRATLARLRANDGIHSPEVNLLVVVDGDEFASAWGSCKLSGSLAGWGWRQVSATEAYYDESRWADQRGDVIRVRRKAFLLWPHAV